jgi:hypothetical protein
MYWQLLRCHLSLEGLAGKAVGTFATSGLRLIARQWHFTAKG